MEEIIPISRRVKIEETVLDILKDADLDTASEYSVREAAAQQLGIDLSGPAHKSLVGQVVEAFLLSEIIEELPESERRNMEETVNIMVRETDLECRKIKQAVLGILKEADLEKTTQESVREAAAQQLGIDLSGPGYKKYITKIITRVLISFAVRMFRKVNETREAKIEEGQHK